MEHLLANHNESVKECVCVGEGDTKKKCLYSRFCTSFFLVLQLPSGDKLSSAGVFAYLQMLYQLS